jgi:hypothetical protein
MRWCIAGLFFVLAGTPAPADSAAALTPKEAAEGWLLLFDGESTFGWTVKGDASVNEGTLVLGGAKPAALTTLGRFGPGEIRWTARQAGRGATLTWGGEPRPLAAAAESGADALRIVAGQPAPLVLNVPAGGTLTLQHLAYRPAAMQALFNGRDLGGWRQLTGDPKREKSVFRVTAEGWLNVKNGPGDLQTDGQYADFLLQLECISNGRHLNSGIFFRALPGQYQQGYEAQIHNGFKDGRHLSPPVGPARRSQ